MNNPLDSRPKRVCIVALGTSLIDYVGHVVGSNLEETWDEIWSVNMGINIFKHDKLWVMDDLRVQAKALPAYGRALAQHDKPIITSQPYPEFPMSIRYPIEQVVEAVGDDFFRNTVCYAIGYAMVTGVKELTLYGCDFFYPQTDLREEGGQNAAYLLGLARHFGMTFRLPQSTTLLSAHLAKGENGRPLYGYAVQPNFKGVNDGSGTGESPQLRKDEKQPASTVGQGQSGNTDQGGPEKRAAPVRASGENLRRRGRRNRASPGLVLAGSKKAKPASAGGMRAQIAIGPDGRSEAFQAADTPETRKNLEV